ncbi:bifunctional DNA-formamidopyrimidine glycosylase/DNA-(apurinic or apyrimidinic site) lyase [Macrococcus equipercicus]|uniref:Formamidopyrimidine-DNA glycosylase n=1 Tax=Macrococcus equipercicus TaxID=69967 RepID=A0A9Q9BM99_9STAP|nr:bifunctional DNA-formamidopyrimidine glycosylase/DNA-(apurinic or apyrimidinic site) lyase [Macrococcus equipercicus]KAA1039909.1 bifunctional DNA-formamidopyrimidine glycosylase/DNA-(apurinic or apyrimidinic site) lyase [Macrococcus equipercicus]UTH13140.1 bifunctional DNA-formamidopyrimidine glycosylase/DNA-(apurinic or apyrimidinic site) lyase [Macrococcus equipercicus]
MPELPEVEHVKRGLSPKILGEIITGVTFSDKVTAGKAAGKQTIIKGIDLKTFEGKIIGSTIKALDRRSKYLIFTLENELHEHYIISHLGMSGAYFVVDRLEDIGVPNYINHWHVAIHLQSGKQLIYSDIRRFGELRYIERLESAAQIMAIAPEPFDDEAPAYYLDQLTAPKWQEKTIKEAIMNHSVVSGCGNIYACEALHLSRINPNHKVKRLSKAKRTELFEAIVHVLNEGIKYGGSSISSYRNVEGKEGFMQTRFNIYGRKTCGTCGGPVTAKVIATRNTHYCTHCQK